MNFARYLKLLLFVCFGVSVTALPSYANSDLRFVPAKPWDVSEITPVDDFSGECSIQSEFNNGFIMQLNGASNWVQLLNLNIRQNAFEINKEYQVKLEVPGTARRIIDSVAYKPNVISVPLKGQKELYKAIRDVGLVEVSIEGNVFQFKMDDFANAAKSFEYCMAGGGTSNDLAVSTKGMSEDQKDLMVNEAIAFESAERAQDADIVDVKDIEDNTEDLALAEPAAETSSINVVPAPKVVEAVTVKTPHAVIHKTTSQQELDFSGGPDFRYDATDTAALAKIAVLEDKLKMAQQANARLNEELNVTLREGEQERLSISSENWDLEQATKRYNEAERQIKRIGQDLQKERARCAMEKQELEAMLFDPDLTSQEQLARLATLEQELAQAKAVIANLKAQMGI